ncbi:MAG: NRDE family protein [Bacillota bacterium]|nr:NRDE family protein [Bacillota bacterium]
MCTILFAINEHEKYPLIILGNRDESYSRPSMSIHVWNDKNIIAGKDLKDGGIWMGMNKEGKIGFLTNFRNKNLIDSSKKSRGHILNKFLSTDNEIRDFAFYLHKYKDSFNPFNIVYGDLNNLFYYSNILDETIEIGDGIHGLSNAFLDTDWKKVISGKKKLRDLLSKNEITKSDLFKILDNTTKSWNNLPTDTGMSKKEEHHLSSMFISGNHYGTVFQTVILVDTNNNITIFEKHLVDNCWHSKKICFPVLL